MNEQENTTAPAEGKPASPEAPAAAPEAPAESSESSEKTEKKPLFAKPIDPHAMLTVSPSPHIKSPDTTRSVMVDVIIALIPALIWGIYVYGFRTLTITVISIAAAVLSEGIYEKLMKRPVTVLDFSAAVTGLLVAFNMPSSVPLWIPLIGSVFAIIVVKQLYGGIGKNFANPALAARAFLMLAWPNELTATVTPFARLDPFAISVDCADVVASATPMMTLKSGEIPTDGLFNLLIGVKAGTVGEISALLLLVGGIYLLVRHVITWHIPVAYLGTVAVIAYLFPRLSTASANALYRWDFVACELICGGLMLGAVYMATDYVTSPVTANGRILFGIGCGALTMFIRYFGVYNEGVTFAILIMNTLVWYIDRLTRPKRFGGVPKNG